MSTSAVDVAVVILTFNEESNIEQALSSVCGWARQVFVFDSYSTDETVRIASSYPCIVAQNTFENYGKQRNAALTQLPITAEWVFFLDADEWMPEDLKQEVESVIARKPRENGFWVKWRLYWNGRWIRRGYYPTWVLRLFRRGKARCEERGVNEHLVVDGEVGFLKNDFIHEDRKGLDRWLSKHRGYAHREALELLKGRSRGALDAKLWGSQAQRKRWIQRHVWRRLPPLVRPFLYFGYRYVLRGGFLDGAPALQFHALQALWFQLLIDVNYLKLRRAQPDFEKPRRRR